MFKKLIPILIIAILGILDFALIGFAWQNPTQAPPGGNLTLPWIKSGTNVYLTNNSDKVGIGTTNPLSKLSINGGLHVGGDSDAGDNNLIVDGTALISGTFTTKVPTLVTAITSATNGSIEIPETYTDSGGFATALHQTTRLTSGWRQHLSLGNYRTGSGWEGGFFIGLGGNDNYPTNYYLFDKDGGLSHNSGKITTTGNVGIGTTGPATKLELQGTSAPVARLGVSSSLLNSKIGAIEFRNASNAYLSKIESYASDATYADQTDLRFFTTYQTSQERVRITSQGNVGIGTTNPVNIFDVNINTATWNGIAVHTSSGSSGGVAFLGGDGSQYGMLYLYPNSATQSVSIRASGNSYLNGGNVGIGTTNPTAKLAIAGSAVLQIKGDSASPTWPTEGVGIALAYDTDGTYQTSSGGSGTGSISSNDWNAGVLTPLRFNASEFGFTSGSSVLRLYINPDGKVGIGVTGPTYRLQLPNTADVNGRGQANQWVTYSDIRYKTNIRPIGNALDKINQLEGVYFNWKSNNIQEIGLIAQQVEPIIPEVVTTDSEGYKGLDYGKLTSLLIQGIKEQQIQIESQQQQINELKTQLNNL